MIDLNNIKWKLIIAGVFLLVGFLVGFNARKNKPLTIPVFSKDTILKVDTIRTIQSVIKYIKVRKIMPDTNVIDRKDEFLIYDDSVNDSIPTGHYDIKHTIVINKSNIDSVASSIWNVSIQPIEKVVIRDIKQIISQDVIKEVYAPFYKDSWFYISTGILALTILLLR